MAATDIAVMLLLETVLHGWDFAKSTGQDYAPDPARVRDLASRSFDRGFHPDGTKRQFAAAITAPNRTPLLRELYANDPEEAARRMVHVPMGRFAEAVELANAALFLASDEASYITASTFLVDGGLSGAYVTPL